MKELLSFVSSKTQSLLGQSFPQLKVRGSEQNVARNVLAFFAEAANTVRPNTDIDDWVKSLGSLKITERIVAYEASFATAVCLDVSNPQEQSRTARMLELSPEHIAGLGLGVGHALSTLNISADITPSISEHYLGWMAMDAYGMSEGYFRWCDRIYAVKTPPDLPPLAMSAFDQGLGRGIWFAANGDAAMIHGLVERFPLWRQPNLWRGVGLMTSFWGAEDEFSMKQLLRFSKQFRPFFQQGAAHGVSFRCDLDEVTEYTKAAAQLICGATVSEINELSQVLMAQNMRDNFDSRAYLNWQNDLTKLFSDGELLLIGEGNARD